MSTILEVEMVLRQGLTVVFKTHDGDALCRDCVLRNWKEVVDSMLHSFHDGWDIESITTLGAHNKTHCDECCFPF